MISSLTFIFSFENIQERLVNYKNDKIYYLVFVVKNDDNLIKKTNDGINRIIKDKNYNFSKSILTIAKSGTISLDVCKNFSPLITIYKMSLLNYLLMENLGFFVKIL